jgi:hypothetical protein
MIATSFHAIPLQPHVESRERPKLAPETTKGFAPLTIMLSTDVLAVPTLSANILISLTA